MKLSRNLIDTLSSAYAAPAKRASVVTLGNFDGVHLGHQAIIAALQKLAQPENLAVKVVTFAPHPRDYFASLGRGTPVLQIDSVRERLVQLAKHGVDETLLLRFNHALANLSAHDFVAQVLVKRCNAKHVVVGRDVRFGHQRTGDLALLQALGQQYGFSVHTIEDVLQQNQCNVTRISSSAIRTALATGDIVTSNQLLGRPYSVSGRVIHGRKIGRTLNCPTLNIVPHMKNPALRGICVVAVHGLAEKPLNGVASMGLRPTVENTTRFSLEVHVFDWAGNAYGKRVSIEFLHKLRDEAAYIDLATLQTAIEADVLAAQSWLALDRFHSTAVSASSK